MATEKEVNEFIKENGRGWFRSGEGGDLSYIGYLDAKDESGKTGYVPGGYVIKALISEVLDLRKKVKEIDDRTFFPS